MLTLKYRPQSIGDLVGQDDVKLALEKAFTNNKIASAYLLTGPRGAGKTSTARIIAKSLNCKNKQAGEKATLTPCGKCSSCINIANSSDIDVVEIDAASHGGVDDARELVIRANLSAINSDYKIYIIDEVHMASKDAFNALLKLFEEPPANVIFILATTESHKVLPTISSRCQQFRFKPISRLDCFKRLKDICEIEEINISDDGLKLIAEESEGALRDALSILEQVSVFSEEGSTISKELIEKTLGKVSEKEILNLVKAILAKEAVSLLKQIDDIFLKNPDPQILNAELFQALIKLLEEMCLQEGKEELQGCMEIISSQGISRVELLYIAEEISKHDNLLKQSSLSSQLFKALSLKLSHRDDFIEIKELRDRIIKLEEANAISPKKLPKKDLGVAYGQSPVVKPLEQVSNFSAAVQLEDAVKAEALPPQNDTATEDKQYHHEEKVAMEAGDLQQPQSANFMQFLSPATKGLIVSSKAVLSLSADNKAVLLVPERFKFLKAKLENKSEELLQAIKQAGNHSVINILINIGAETNPEPKNASMTTETCCDREAKLDEVLQAGISIFGGNVVRE